MATNVVNFKQQQATDMANFLQTQEWSRFCTFTTPYELTLPSVRRLCGRFHDRATKRVFRGKAPRLFWVAEKFQAKDGYHTHALLYYDKEIFGNDLLAELDDCYQVVSAAKQNGNTKFRVQFTNYDKRKAAGKYCSKYLLKKYSDYDLLV